MVQDLYVAKGHEDQNGWAKILVSQTKTQSWSGKDENKWTKISSKMKFEIRETDTKKDGLK